LDEWKEYDEAEEIAHDRIEFLKKGPMTIQNLGYQDLLVIMIQHNTPLRIKTHL
jgi:hypothetical protein